APEARATTLPKTAAARPASAPEARGAATAPSAATQAPTAVATPARGTWSVQVGAFGSADSARKLVRELEADGYAAYVSDARRDGKTLHRVRVGPEPARDQADALARRLKARGLPVSIVAND
ncbi:MAG: SPOR domain-containing protein, partial [Gemmatimonadetes bacterium]|nr:SPOR domain-containing protein [Gemmatimonadota bacterium]